MKNFFKVAIIAIALTMTAVTTNAQEKGDMAIGANVAYGLGDGLTSFGVNFQYNVLVPLRLDGSFSYFTDTTLYDFSVNAHWLFPVNEKMTVYPLAGFGMLSTPAESSTNFGLNIGGGVDFHITQAMHLIFEPKYRIGSGSLSRFSVSAGVAYRF
jgi:outer membrane protein X